MRIGVSAFCAARTTSTTFSGPPMLPGVMRTAATPASIARRARLALKWMSAITGIGERRTIFLSAFASSIFGTAQRTTSQPADASAAICAVVADTSCVGVSVIDWTTTGAPPPISTCPTRIERRLATEVADVVREPNEEEEQHDGDSDCGDALVHLPPNRAPANALDDREGDMPAIEWEQRQQVEQCQRQAEQAKDPQIRLSAL